MPKQVKKQGVHLSELYLSSKIYGFDVKSTSAYVKRLLPCVLKQLLKVPTLLPACRNKCGSLGLSTILSIASPFV